MTVMTVTKSVIGFSNGRVMRPKTVQAEAPSISAAS